MIKPSVILVYDQQCPLCDNYAQMLRLRKNVGELQLVDARQNSEAMARVNRLGLDIDQGVVLFIGQSYYYGPDAIHALALLSSNNGFFNRLNAWLFRYQTLARFLYPLLKAGRNLLLKLKGITKVNNLKR